MRYFISISLVASFVIAEGLAQAASVVIDRLEASVNSSLILLSDVEQFRKTEKFRVQTDPIFAGTPVATEGDKASTTAIVQYLVDERLISQAYPVTDADVEQEINSIQSNNHLDRAGLKAALSSQGISFDDYFELIRTGASKRNLIDRDIRTKVTISDDDVKNFYYNHYSRSAPAVRAYHLKIILVSPRSYKTVAAAKEAAQRALKELKAGDSFEEVAKRVSDDSSASSGGDLGTMTEDQMSPVIRDNLRSLRIGDISPVLGSSKSGFMILKLVDIKSDDGGRIDKVKDDVRNQLIAQEYQHQISLWLERQRQNAFIHLAGHASAEGIPNEVR